MSYECEFPLYKENLCTVLKAFSASPRFPRPLAQNNPYAKVAYFGVVYFGSPYSAL